MTKPTQNNKELTAQEKEAQEKIIQEQEKADKEAKENADKENADQANKVKSGSKKKFDQVSYDRYIELQFISYQIDGRKNLKPEFQKEIAELEKKVLSNPGVKAKVSKTLIAKGTTIKVDKGVPVSNSVFNLFTEKQQEQYFEV